MLRAFIFPGQGSQAVGMGREVYEAFSCAREVFEKVNEALGQNLSKLIFEGPESELTLTENAQPALMAVSLTILRVLEKEGGINLAQHVQFVAGHSLGEYSALAAARSFSLVDTARLLKTRGQAMQQAVPLGQGAMAAILGLELAQVEAIAAQVSGEGICVVANDNCPGQVVISGHKQAVEQAVTLSQEQGAKRSLLLNVSAPFHCALMNPAAEVMAEALKGVHMVDPIVPLISNVSAKVVQEAGLIRNLLIEQIAGRVRWREGIEIMAARGVQEMVEIGSGKVLTGLNKRINGNLKTTALNTPADIEDYLKNTQNISSCAAVAV